jgi:hypothetical protein
MRKVEDICADIDRLLPEIGHDTPEVTDPFPERIQAREAELRAVWALADLRNDRIRAVTGIEFRPLDDSIRDCVESLLSVAGVKPKVRSVSARYLQAGGPMVSKTADAGFKARQEWR